MTGTIGLPVRILAGLGRRAAHSADRAAALFTELEQDDRSVHN